MIKLARETFHISTNAMAPFVEMGLMFRRKGPAFRGPTRNQKENHHTGNDDGMSRECLISRESSHQSSVCEEFDVMFFANL
jgi:hypothetical protein